MEIRHARNTDMIPIARLEARCFPPEKAASRESFTKRIEAFPECFWLLTEGEELLSVINGMANDRPVLHDRMYEDATMHNPKGEWQMIFGVMTAPEVQHNGYAKLLMEHVIMESRERGRKGIVLTCRNELLSFYEEQGFINEGISMSKHGGVVWNDMRLLFAEAL